MTPTQSTHTAQVESPFPTEFPRTGSWVLGFVGLGIFARLVRYLLHYPFTGDEARLASNFVHHTYRELTGPLYFNQVAPVPLLWAERFMSVHLGFHEMVLRLPLIVAGILSVLLFAHVASRLLKGPAMVLAIAVFSVAYYPIRQSAELKHCGLDLFVSLGLIALAVEWWRAPERSRWLWALAAAMPVALFSSFPAVFAATAISGGLALPVWRSRSARVRGAFMAFNVALLGSLVVLMAIVLKAQYSAVDKEILPYWKEGSPLRVIGWAIRTLIGEDFGYPFGGVKGGGIHGLLAFGLGMAVFWRSRWKWFAVTAALMLMLGMTANVAHRYPFGWHPKFSQYFAPACCLCIGAGLARAISWLRRPRWQATTIRWLLIAFVAVGLGGIAGSCLKPYKGKVDQLHREFARWFWTEHPDRQYVCVDLDLHRQLYADEPHPVWGDLPHPYYICYRARFASPAPAVLPDKPLRYVAFHDEVSPPRQAALDAWLAEMSVRYELTGHSSYRVPPSRESPSEFGIYEAFDFNPRHR